MVATTIAAAAAPPRTAPSAESAIVDVNGEVEVDVEGDNCLKGPTCIEAGYSLPGRAFGIAERVAIGGWSN